MKDQDITSL